MDFSNLQGLILYINGFGIFAPLVAFVLFILQAILPVFPYVILAAAGGILFGFKLGVLLSWLGALTGACIAYWMCRALGYSQFLQRFYTRMGYDVRQLDSSMAFWTIIVARIIPIVPTPLINAAAALGGVSFPNFVVSSAIGKIPSAVLYTGLGLALFNTKDIPTFLLIIGLTLLFFLLVKYQGKKMFSKVE
ncbi:MAG: VTT domain-containing protein [Syntrophomonadaceae bacterium]|nr:VTT domain-containing protein [Syntrophomonadaceae bacterium]